MTQGVPPGNTNPHVQLNLTRVGPQKQYFTYKGETYLVQAFRRSATEGAPADDITPMRDWTEAGKHAMAAADKIFVENRVDLATVKTIHVPLTGDVALSQTPQATTAANVSIGSEIKYSRTVTDKPTESIMIEQTVRDKISNEIRAIGQETATWRDPTRLYQNQAEQRRQETQQRAEQNPPANNQQPPAAEATTPLPSLTFTPPPPYATNERENIDAFLKNRAGTPTQAKTEPATVIFSQINALNPLIVKTEQALLQELKDYVQTDAIKSDNPFRYEQTDIEEIFNFMANQFSQPQHSLFFGLAQGEDTKLQRILQSPQAPSSDEDKKLLLKAFGLFCQSNHRNQAERPNAFFKAMHAILNRQPKNVITARFTGSKYDYSTDPTTQKQIVLISRQGDQPNFKYKMDQRWPATGAIDPSKTLFILKTETGYQGFDRSALNQITQNPLLPPHQTQQTIRARPAYLGDTLHYDAGGGGDCGAKAIAAALLEKEGIYFEHQYAWESAVQERSVTIRRETMQYLYDHPEEFIEDSRFDQFTNAFKEDTDHGIKRHLRAGPIKSKLDELLSREKTALSPDDKKWMVQLYAMIASQEGVWLDKPFFLGYALKNNQPLAMILNFSRPPGVPEALVYAASPRLINKDEFLFVSYDGAVHFQATNRSHADLQGIIDRSNAENKNIVSRHEFLEILQTINSSTAAVITQNQTQQLLQKIAELKTNDPHGYLTLRSLVDKDTFTKFENGTDISGFLDQLPNGLAIAEATADLGDQRQQSISARLRAHMNRSTDLQARASFFQALAEAQIASEPGPISEQAKFKVQAALNRLKTDDTKGYLALRAKLLSIDPAHDIVSTLNIHNMATILPWLLNIDLGADRNVVSMLAKGAEDLQATLSQPENGRISSLAAFLKNPSKETSIGVLEDDPATYFLIIMAMRWPDNCVQVNDIRNGNWGRLFELIKENKDNAMILARTNLVKTLKSSDQSQLENILLVLKANDPRGYLALESLINKGPLEPQALKGAIEELVSHGAQIPKIIEEFITVSFSKQTEARYQFFKTLEAQKQEPNADVGLQAAWDQLKEFDLYAALAIEDALEELKANNEDATINDFTIFELKKEISQRPYMQYRAQFYSALDNAQQEQPTQNAQQTLTDAIESMKTFDIQGWLTLVEMTKKATSAEIMQQLLTSDDSLDQFITMVKSSEMMTRGECLRTVFDQESTKDDISPKFTALQFADLHGALVLGSLIYDKHPPEGVAQQPTIAEKAQQGLAIIRNNAALLKEITPIELAQKLITTHLVTQDDASQLAEGAARAEE